MRLKTSSKVLTKGVLRGALVGAVVALGLTFAGTAKAQVQIDHSKITGPNACGECHKKTVSVWQNTHHFKTFKDLPRRKEANEIAKKMGLKRIKSGSLCLDCHFTTTDTGGKRDAIAGISCESCHGAAKGYLKRHGEYSGKKKETESAAEAAQRWKDSEAAGMIRINNVYTIAKNCYSCHTVPQEKLVNEGGHSASSNFELVSWSQGEVRHNVWYNGGSSNAESPQNRLRLLYVVGMAVEVETALRAVGNATEKKKYAVAMAKRADAARKEFQKIANALSEPEVKAIASAASGAQLKLNNKGPLNSTADQIAASAKAIASKYDGSSFGGIDGMIPSKYKGSVSQ